MLMESAQARSTEALTDGNQGKRRKGVGGNRRVLFMNRQREPPAAMLQAGRGPEQSIVS